MYNNFFGFKEKPFKLVPNPAYLFLSKCHEEALAHLNYAISQGDGFVQITGEVGTGKTTLCRAFLESLTGSIEAAYIFNPKLGPKQLLKTINDDFGIKSEGETTKDLIDTLNAFLIQKKTEGRRAILIIDEAQNLAKNVLEQLRLLSNLETNQDKLLQIVLVGQPELAEMLDSHDLRQIGQRITLSYHLTPLGFNETRQYIQYRINIAAQRQGIKFDRCAFRQIYKYSGGVPRLINIVCDRTLLTAFVLNQHKISGNICKAAIAELSSRRTVKKYGLANGKNALLILAVLIAGLLAVVFHQQLVRAVHSLLNPPGSTAARPQPAVGAATSAPQTPAAGKSMPPATEKTADNGQTLPAATVDLADYLMGMDVKSSRRTALGQALNLWQTPIQIQPYLDSIGDDQAFFRLAIKPTGFFIHRLESDLDLLVRLNLPSILEFYPPGAQSPGYLTLLKIQGNRILLAGGRADDRVLTDPDEIKFYWSGVAYIPWKNFLSIWGTIPMRAAKDSIITLKLLLREIGYTDIQINADYDDAARKAVEQVQAKYGVPVDGVVGPLTKIILYREDKALKMPTLTQGVP